jgi:enterochelin esterase-like enzyme
MTRRTTKALCLVRVAILAGLASPVPARSSAELIESVDSVSLAGSVHARVILPAGYAQSHRRYPVVYFLHGLPGTASSYLGNDWVADALARAGPAILVMPQGARDGDSDPEYLNWGAGRNWETYVATELPGYIDARFRTIRSREGRALVGLSAGGYGATILGLHHLSSFSVIESWSGYFHPTDPSGTHALDRGPDTSALTLVGRLKARQPTFLAFYVGKGDTRFRDENVAFARELKAAGVPHVFDVYPGGHATSLWQAHAVAWLRLALAHLARPG